MQVRGRRASTRSTARGVALGHAYGGGSQFFAMWIVGRAEREARQWRRQLATRSILADLFENVADACREREAICLRRTAAHLRASSTSARRGSRTICRRRACRPGDHVGLYLYNCTEYIEAALAAFKIARVAGQHQLPLRRGRAALPVRRRRSRRRSSSTASSRRASPPSRRALPATADARRRRGRKRRRTSRRSARSSTRPRSRRASAERDFGERSGDDLYLLYTGGTTGMPKGVMWRHEDVFFAGLQGGNPGGAGHHRRRNSSARTRAAANAPTTLPVAPLMHGNGHWASLIGMHGGGKVVLGAVAAARRARDLVAGRARAVNMLSIVGDAMARPLARGARRAGRGVRPVIAVRAVVGGRAVLGRREGAASREAAATR